MPETADKRIPSSDECVIRNLLDRWANERGDKVFAVFEDGRSWTYAETHAIVRQTALGLQQLGVKQGDCVLSWLPNGPDCLRVWFAINYLGAAYVPVNLAYRGKILEHVLANTRASRMIAHAELVPRLAAVERSELVEVVVIGGHPLPVDSLSIHDASRLAPTSGELLPPAHPIEPWDTQAVIYTSGTTGPSKGVLTSYLQNYEAANTPFSFVGPDDRYLVNLPLFHVGGTGAVYVPLIRGGSCAIVESFATQSFWSVVNETKSTMVTLLGVMASFVVKEPPSPDDLNHTLRYAMMVPLCEDAIEFYKRFGVEIYTVFNMSETSCPIVSGLSPSPLGTCGTPRAGVDARIVDDNDCEVAPGEVGELILRTDTPWAMNHGYLNNPEATARAWRNGWFHTGDAFRVDEDGNYFFVDRIKDAIRRRGENISSFEVENEVCSHPAVKEAAAVAVASEFAEDEVLVAVSLVEGATLDPAELVSFLIPRMPHFMVPRYVRLLQHLPKTPTQKVQKHLLRSEGITADTFDRVAAGIIVKREKIGTLA